MWSRWYIYHSFYYHHQIAGINLSHCCHIFPRLCAEGGCTIICVGFIDIPGWLGFFSFITVQFYYVYLMWLHHHMVSLSYISGEWWVLCLLSLCSLMMCANNKSHYDPIIIFVCLYITPPHYNHYADLSESIDLLKCLSGTFCLECMSKI